MWVCPGSPLLGNPILYPPPSSGVLLPPLSLIFCCPRPSAVHMITSGSAPLIRFPNRGLAHQIVKVRPTYSRGPCQMRNSIRKLCIWSFLMVPSGKKLKIKPTTPPSISLPPPHSCFPHSKISDLVKSNSLISKGDKHSRQFTLQNVNC